MTQTAYEGVERVTRDARVEVPTEHGIDWLLAVGFFSVVLAMYGTIGYAIWVAVAA